MNKSIAEKIEMINRLGGYVQKIDELDKETTLKLYELNKNLTDVVYENLEYFDVGAKIVLCRQQEVILNKLVTFDLDYRNENQKNIYTPAIQGYRKWSSVELLKDKGLVGYFLSKELEAKPIMIFCSENGCGDIQKLFPEQELVFSNEEESLSDQYLNLLKTKYESMDVLVLHGMYHETIEFLNKYRKYRPDGKVYCGLDMNSRWLSRIDFSESYIRKFLKQCDIVATSSKQVRDLVNYIPEVNKPCYYLPNGFSNFMNLNVIADASIKENVILTVGRIGDRQKNNIELLVAFGQVAHLIPDWKIRLVGNIEESFEPEIDMFFEEHPNLIDRVTFTGPIIDKQMLYEEYARAKCFTLTSIFEGGPNVYSEALVHGCKFIFSNFDSAEEMINYGELGYIYEIGNINELAQCLLKMAENSSKQDFEVHIPKALAYAKKEYDWETNAKKLAYMLNN